MFLVPILRVTQLGSLNRGDPISGRPSREGVESRSFGFLACTEQVAGFASDLFVQVPKCLTLEPTP